VIFQLEPLEPIVRDIFLLAKAQWEELESERKYPFNPDVKRYLEFNRTGFLRQYTAREGEIVGQAGMYVSPSMHSQVLIATEDTWYLKPEYRKGSNALRFLRFVENDLKSIGVQEIHMTSTLANKSGKIMLARGYTHVLNGYLKEL